MIRPSYLQFPLSLDLRALWYRDLMAALGGVKGVRWQKGFFHVTAAFIIDEIDVAEAKKMAEVMGEELAGVAAPVLAFDKLEAFTTQGGGMHVVYLTASRVPDEWVALIDLLQAKLIGLGYHLGPFQLHVTLARVPAGSIALEVLRGRIGRVAVPQIHSTLAKADYRFYREFKSAVREWTLPHC